MSRKRSSPYMVIWEQPDNDPLGFVALGHKYFEWMRVKNFSSKTITIRRYGLGFFLYWSKDQLISRPSEVTREMIQRYQSHLSTLVGQNNQPVTSAYRNILLAAICYFLRYLVKKGYLLYNPAAEVKYYKKANNLPRAVLTPEEAEQIINQPDINSNIGIRDRVILESLYSTGIRRHELLRLTVHDLDLQRGTLIVIEGKGKKDRVVPIGERACKWIVKYLREVRTVGRPNHDILLVTMNGKPIRSVDFLTILVRKYINAAGIAKKGSCHLFRHSMATQMLENGADIRYIQEILGHTDLATTEIYTRVSIRKLKEIHDQTHPTGRLDQDSAAAHGEPEKKVIRSGAQPGRTSPPKSFWDRDPIVPHDLIAQGKKFLHSLSGYGGYASSSVTNIGSHLKQFVLWCHREQVITPEQVTKTAIENFQTYLYQYKSKITDRPLSVRTRSQRQQNTSLFFRWLAKNGHIPHNPTDNLDMPKVPKRLPRHVPSYPQIQTIFEQPDLSDPLGVRDRTIMETLYSTGLRRQELVRLTTHNLDLDRGTLIVINGKQNKDRIVPIGQGASRWIEKYLDQVRPLLLLEPEQNTLFLTKRGNPLTIDNLSHTVAKYIKAADIPTKGSCHILRHAMATHMLENGADIRYIQEILGHNSLSTTEIYTKVSIAKLKEVHSKTHPAKTYPTKTPQIRADLEHNPEE